MSLHRASNAQAYVIATSVYETAADFAASVASRKKVTPDELDVAHKTVAAFIGKMKLKEIVIGSDIARKAVEVAGRFGKVTCQPVDLKFGDCFVYATCKSYRLPLLFIGNDFQQIDLRSILVNPAPK